MPTLILWKTELRFLSYVYSEEWGPMQFEFELRVGDLSESDGDYIELQFPMSNMIG